MISKETCGFFIQQIHNALEKNANNQLRKKELTFSQINVLLTLADVPEKKLSFKELEKRLALAQSTTAGLISRLELKGLVSVSGDRNDKRMKYVQITSAGERCCKDAETAMLDMEEKLLTPLSESERREFLSLLKKVNRSFADK